jgi:HPt (histidine-containing phosphotransfer) domain-containing protein
MPGNLSDIEFAARKPQRKRCDDPQTLEHDEFAQSAVPLPPLAPWEAEPAPRDGAPGTKPIAYDPDEALELAVGDHELLVEMAQTFCSTAGGLRQRLRRAIEQRDAQSVRIVAHTLKGSARQFAALRASTAAQALELAGKANDWPQILAGGQALDAALDQLLTELAALATGEYPPSRMPDAGENQFA